MMFKTDNLLYIILAIVVIGFILYYFFGYDIIAIPNSGALATQPVRQGEQAEVPAPADDQTGMLHPPTPASPFGATSNLPNNPQLDAFPRDQLTAKDLLPKDQASSIWAQAYPEGQGTLQDKNFLQAGYHVGINTVGQTLKNANMQLRSDPPNPQVRVSPWSQSTIEPDVNRRYFEIGSC